MKYRYKTILEIKKLLDDEDLENIYVDEQKTDHTDLKSFRENPLVYTHMEVDVNLAKTFSWWFS